MNEFIFFRDLGIATLAASVLALPAFVLRVPLLLAYILAGVLLGTSLGFGVITSSRTIAAISQLGLIMLMFLLGLEIDVRKLLRSVTGREFLYHLQC